MGDDEGQEDAMEESQEREHGPMLKKTRTNEAEAALAQAAAAAASTHGPLRRQAMKSRIVVHKRDGSEKYSLVLSATETVAEIDRVIAARDRAIMDEARELSDASTLADARRILVQRGRACLARGSDGLNYLVLDFALQKRSRYYAFEDWASTPEGDLFPWKKDRYGRWSKIPRESEAGRFVIPSSARTVFKTHCDHIIGGQVWLDVLMQMGGCPAEFVDAWSAVINQRLQVAV